MVTWLSEDNRAQHAQGVPQSKPRLCRCTRVIDGLVLAGQGSRLGDAGGRETGDSQREYPQGRPRGVQYCGQQVPVGGVDQLSLSGRLYPLHWNAPTV